MSDSRVRVPWYMLVAMVLLPGLFSAVVLSVSLKASERAVEAEAESRRASELALCEVLRVMDDAYVKSPPSTAAGIEVAKAIRNLIRTNQCP